MLFDETPMQRHLLDEVAVKLRLLSKGGNWVVAAGSPQQLVGKSAKGASRWQAWTVLLWGGGSNSTRIFTSAAAACRHNNGKMGLVPFMAMAILSSTWSATLQAAMLVVEFLDSLASWDFDRTTQQQMDETPERQQLPPQIATGRCV